MVEFCTRHGIPHEVCGKLIVATNSEEAARLEDLLARGVANGLEGLRLLAREAMLEIEPHAGGVRALHVPSTGITDYAAVTAKYAEIARQHGRKCGQARKWWDLTVREARLEARQATQWWCGLGREILRRGMW